MTPFPKPAGLSRRGSRRSQGNSKEAKRILDDLPYGSPGDKAKRESMIEHANVLQNMGMAKIGQPPVPNSTSGRSDSSRYRADIDAAVNRARDDARDDARIEAQRAIQQQRIQDNIGAW